jgi:PAS domain S-box-containing protein
MPHSVDHSPVGQAILVVDDDPDIREALRDYLEHDGYRVETVGAGEPAIERVRHTRFGAVLLDVGLPDVDGLTVLRSLHEIEPSLPVVIFTAFTSYENTVGSLSKGAFAYLTKPYNIEEIRAILQRAVSVQDLAVKAHSAEQALTISEERFRSVFQSAHDAIILADQQGLVVSWNQAAGALFGYSNAEICGLPLTHLMPARYREAHTRGMARFRATGTSQVMGKTVELHGLRKNGSEFPLELSLGSWSTPDGTYYAGIIRDISERKRAEESLRASEERFRTLVSNLPGVVFRCAFDSSFTITFMSRSILDVIGYPAEDFLDNRARVFADCLHPEDRPSVTRLIADAIFRRAPFSFECRLLHAQGGHRWIAARGQGAFDEAGALRWLDGVFFDVTERRTAEDALERISRQNALLLNAAGEGIYGLDLDGRTTFTNPAAARMLGYDLETLISTPMHSVLHHTRPDGSPYPREDCPIYAAFKDGLVHRSDQEVFWRKDGTCFPVDYVSTPIREDGRLVGAVVVFQDISARKQAESALRESEERFRQLAEHMTDVIWMTDPAKQTMLYINPAYERVWKRSTASLHADPRSWLEAIHPDDRSRVERAALTRQTSGQYDELYRIFRPDGTMRWIHDRAFPIADADGHIYRMTGLAEDVTDMKLAEDRLRRASDELDRILASLPGAVLIVSDALEITYANALAHQHFGSPLRGLPGSLILDVLPFSSADWTRLSRAATPCPLAGAPPGPDHEFSAHGRIYRCRPFPVPALDGPGELVGLMIWDVTEQHELQDQLIQAEKLATLGTLVSGMAHEMNNPMQGILSLSELILDERDPARILDYARDIKEYAHHMAAVVMDFVTYARPATRAGEAEVDLNERLSEALKMVRHNPDFGHIEVVVHLNPLPHVTARPAEIEQVFVNILGNAVQAMNGQGRLTLTSSVREGAILVAIADTGCGIPKQFLTRIFDPFFTTKEPGKGTGLGLSISEKIVKKYSGAIKVESEEGVGTIFTLRFPAPQPPASATQPTA